MGGVKKYENMSGNIQKTLLWGGGSVLSAKSLLPPEDWHNLDTATNLRIHKIGLPSTPYIIHIHKFIMFLKPPLYVLWNYWSYLVFDNICMGTPSATALTWLAKSENINNLLCCFLGKIITLHHLWRPKHRLHKFLFARTLATLWVIPHWTCDLGTA